MASFINLLEIINRVEIIITIGIQNHAKSNKNFGLVLRAISIIYYNFNP